MLAVQANGRSIRTVEGLARDGELHPLQRAFHEKHALQCGFCTSGFLMSLEAFLRSQPDPSEQEIREAWQATSAAARATSRSWRPCASPRSSCDESGVGSRGDVPPLHVADHVPLHAPL